MTFIKKSLIISYFLDKNNTQIPTNNINLHIQDSPENTEKDLYAYGIYYKN